VRTFKPTTPDDIKQLLSCVRLEYKNGHYYAIATNQEIASVQYLGETTEADGVVHLSVNQKLIDQCQTEIAFDSLLTITVVPEFAISTLTTMLGWESANCCIFPDETPMNDWRLWAPDKPVTTSKGVMYWDADHIAALAESSPSGKLYFPQHIDVDKPIVVRDLYDENWMGLFIPKPDVSQKQVKTGAKLPDWWLV
jgi:hypothetical protein